MLNRSMTLLMTLTLMSMTHLGCAAGQVDHNAAEPEQLTVMAYNIRHARGMDGEVDLERIAEVIRRSGADVVALQEVDNQTARTDGVDQAAALAELLEMHHVFGRAIDHQGGGYGNAILSRHPITRSHNLALPSVEDGERRAAVSARIAVEDGRSLTLISTHLDHLSQANRLVQIAMINRVLAVGEEPALLLGDMNAEPDTRELSALAEHWVRVCDGDPAPTAGAEDPTVRIDYILARPADRWRVVDAKVIDEPLASDHRPVRAVLELRD